MFEYNQEELRREREYLISWAADLKEKEVERAQIQRGLEEWEEELDVERIRLEKFALDQHRVRTELNTKKLALQEANIPMKEALEEILLLLELEENPVVIADKIRDRLGIVDVKW